MYEGLLDIPSSMDFIFMQQMFSILKTKDSQSFCFFFISQEFQTSYFVGYTLDLKNILGNSICLLVSYNTWKLETGRTYQSEIFYVGLEEVCTTVQTNSCLKTKKLLLDENI